MQDTGLIIQPPFDVRAAIADSLKAIVPAGKTGAAVAIVDGNSQRVLLATKIGENWEVGGELVHTNGTPVVGKLYLAGAW